MSRVDEKKLLDLLIRWNRSQLRGKTMGPDQLCPDDLELREALRERIDQLLRLEGVIESVNEVDRSVAGVSLLSQLDHDKGVTTESSGFTPNASIHVVPKGLRSFDEHDAKHFQELLPGPRDVAGVPDCLRFWKDRIEVRGADESFTIGVLYGPTGSGKSSLLKAGLIPSLSQDITTVYLEAMVGETEQRLLNRLHVECPEIPSQFGLKETLVHLCGEQAAVSLDGSCVAQIDSSDSEPLEAGGDLGGIRGHIDSAARVEPRPSNAEPRPLGSGSNIGVGVRKKVLIVLDQFERWMLEHKGYDESQNNELMEALRVCDGVNVQCLIVVRDDFWMDATRFLRRLGTRFVDGVNANTLELMSKEHARVVLAAFGRAFGALPREEADVSREQTEFLDAAVLGLAEGGRILPLRIALFADVMKGRSWSLTSIDQFVGADEIGVSYLEMTLGGSYPIPISRSHLKAAQTILKALLPEPGTDVGGRTRSYSELFHVAGRRLGLQEFDELVRILDSEFKLITPSEPPSEPPSRSRQVFTETRTKEDPQSATVSNVATRVRNHSDSATEISLKSYQLTHDSLIGTLREWLVRKQSETACGRAELALASRTAMWRTRNDARQLPTLSDFFSIQLLTDRRQWTEVQRQMMTRAALWHGTRWLRIVTITLLVGFGIQFVAAERLNARLKSAIEAVQFASAEELPFVLHELKQLPRERILNELSVVEKSTVGDHRLRAAIGLAEIGAIDTEFLCSQIETVSPDEADNLFVALGLSRDASLKEIRKSGERCRASKTWLLAARYSIAGLYLGDYRIASDLCQIENRPDPIQRTCFIEAITFWPGDVSKLAEGIRTTDDWALRSAVCLGISGIAHDRITNDARAAWLPVFAEWYQTAPDGLTRSAAELALFYWGMELPEPTAVPASESRDWYVNSVGMTLCQIPPRINKTNSAVKKRSDDNEEFVTASVDVNVFFLSDREVSVAQFSQFLADRDDPDQEKPSEIPQFLSTEPKFPAHSISWSDAVMFCNWLSRKENLTPRYERLETQDEFGYEIWRRVPEATGYRLPTENEWEIACRAMTTTAYSCGEGFVLSRYGNIVGPGFNPCGMRLPNRWGLFDLHGNVREWCDDRTPDPEGHNAVTRGGSWTTLVSNAGSSARSLENPNDRMEDIGFRVALPIASRPEWSK